MRTKSLRDQVRQQLQLAERPTSLRKVAEEAEVDYDWLVKFTHGHIEDPGVTKIERVRDALARMRKAA